MQTPFFRALHALAVDHTGLSAHHFEALHIQCVVDLLQRAIVIPADEVIVHRAEQIHGVDHFTHVHLTMAAAVLCRRDQRLDVRPFLVGQITWVAQLVPVVPVTVFDRSHMAPRESVPEIESQSIRAVQGRPLTDSNDSQTFRTDTNRCVHSTKMFCNPFKNCFSAQKPPLTSY